LDPQDHALRGSHHPTGRDELAHPRELIEARLQDLEHALIG
jgi:hypothetical protein